MAAITSTSDRHALVTGGSRGIGAAVVHRLARDGFSVTFTYAENEKAAIGVQERAAAIGGHARAVRTDLTQPDAVDGLFAELGENAVHAVVNNASILAPTTTVVDTPDEVWDSYSRILSRAPFQIIKRAAPLMPPGSAIVNISTVNTVRPVPGIAAYIAGKGALEQLSAAAALELGPSGITVNTIRPGATETDMNRKANPDPEIRDQIAAITPLRRYGRPDDIAAVVAFLVGPDARWVTGQIFSASGGL